MNNPATSWFNGRRLLIATKHGKEAVIAPVLERALGVRCTVPDDYDTDQFGTFTGEVERKCGPLETARTKCEVAMSTYGFDLAVASEGSFGPHPAAGFVSCDDELLVFTDKRHRLEVVVRELSLQTNMSSATVADEEALTAFAQRCGFPAHGLILSVPGTGLLTKGITDPGRLKQQFRRYRELTGNVSVETDMRAMYNPTRMAVIEKAAHKIAEKIRTLCPGCGLPGYGISDAIPGLPCEMCSRPTRSTLAYSYTCGGCGHSSCVANPGKKKEDPAFCDYCNP